MSGDEFKRAHSAALRYLGYRDRSCQEMKAYLTRKEFSPPVIRQVIDRLEENGYLDDARFAERFAAARLEQRRLGKKRLRHELLNKGIAGSLADRVLDGLFEDVEEQALARASGLKKMQGWRGLETGKVRRRLARFLQRQGYSSDTVYRTVEELAPW